jgi:hypothetical protein
MTTPTKARAARPKTCIFKHDVLMAGWEPWLNLRKPGFEWDGSSYTKGDEGLALYAGPLKALLVLAPTGFPTHASLKKPFLEWNQTCGLFGCTAKNADSVISEAADRWRAMCKDVYGMAKAKQVSTNPLVQELIDTIIMSDSTETAPVANNLVAGCPNFDALLTELPDGSESDAVQIVKEICRCPECEAKRAKGGPTAVVHHEEPPPTPSPAKGGQRRETRPKDTGNKDTGNNEKPKKFRLAKKDPRKPQGKKKRNGVPMKRERVPQQAQLTRRRAAAPNSAGSQQKTKAGPKETGVAPEEGNTIIKFPVRMEIKINKLRKGERKEAFIKHAAKGCNQYVAGQSSSASPNYEENIKALLGLIRKRTIKSVEGARKHLLTLA